MPDGSRWRAQSGCSPELIPADDDEHAQGEGECPGQQRHNSEEGVVHGSVDPQPSVRSLRENVQARCMRQSGLDQPHAQDQSGVRQERRQPPSPDRRFDPRTDWPGPAALEEACPKDRSRGEDSEANGQPPDECTERSGIAEQVVEGQSGERRRGQEPVGRERHDHGNRARGPDAGAIPRDARRRDRFVDPHRRQRAARQGGRQSSDARWVRPSPWFHVGLRLGGYRNAGCEPISNPRPTEATGGAKSIKCPSRVSDPDRIAIRASGRSVSSLRF